ncbi:MAG: hypothetical protein EAZ37_01310 [Burkholderiales bacterium]|nr:MAG: hypothetical protein EAZ43_13140 [Betaproteobacteria bacterium]TAG28555.1 MAG: hypothetical protein EAZ37_01310 [Burkholderiales bacterium]
MLRRLAVNQGPLSDHAARERSKTRQLIDFTLYLLAFPDLFNLCVIAVQLTWRRARPFGRTGARLK